MAPTRAIPPRTGLQGRPGRGPSGTRVADDGAAGGAGSLQLLLLVPLLEDRANLLGELAKLGGDLRQLAGGVLGQVQPDAADLEQVLLWVEVRLEGPLGRVVQGLAPADQVGPVLGQLVA